MPNRRSTSRTPSRKSSAPRPQAVSPEPKARRRKTPKTEAGPPTSGGSRQTSKLRKLVPLPAGSGRMSLVPPAVVGAARPEPLVAVAAAQAAASQAAPAERRGKYVYCIIKSNDMLDFGPIGIGPDPNPVGTVLFRDLAAVVSDTPIAVLDPTRENVLAHQRVNEIVMREHTVIPMSFGTVFKTDDDICELLRSAYSPFADVLEKMRGKVEFGLKVLWDRDQIIRQIETEDEDIRRLKKELSGRSGSTYFARMQYGRMIDGALQARSERLVAEIFGALRDVAVAARSNKPIGDRMIMNAAFLVGRDREAAFDAKVKEIATRHDALNFKYTGPWPPYNFVNIRLKLERAR